jgi:hypothetical protein
MPKNKHRPDFFDALLKNLKILMCYSFAKSVQFPKKGLSHLAGIPVFISKRLLVINCWVIENLCHKPVKIM